MVRLARLSCSPALNGNSAFCFCVFNTVAKALQPRPARARMHLASKPQQNSKIKGRLKPSFYFALGAIRTRDLSLKRGVLYLLSYKRKFIHFHNSMIAIHFVSNLMLARTNFYVNSFVKTFL